MPASAAGRQVRDASGEPYILECIGRMSMIDDGTVLTPLTDGTVAGFPGRPYADTASYFDAYMRETVRGASAVQPGTLDQAARLLHHAYTRRATVFACGNGGSAAIANHLQCDHLKGIRNATSLLPRVVSLSTSIELLTAIANDIAYDEVFSYQLESQARPGDVLIAVSSSGRSPNIVRALDWAADHDMRTIALTGFDGGEAMKVADVSIHVEAANYGIVEDLHQAVMHVLAQYIRQSEMTTKAIATSVF